MTIDLGGTLGADDVGQIADRGTPRLGGRPLVLVWAAEPLRTALTELAQERGYQTRVPTTPLEAIAMLLDDGDRIGHAWISLSVSSGLGAGFCEFLADEYPAIHCVTLTAPRGSVDASAHG